MLKRLLIKNLILIEQEEIHFNSGLSVITGETGSGKTALIQAILLILGQRTDASKVRKGCEKAFIQGSFVLNPTNELVELFDAAGVPFPHEEELILSREIGCKGKSRSFIGSQMVPSSFLQKIAPHLVDFVGQHAAYLLKSSDTQGAFLDLFADVDLTSFQKAWEEEKSLKRELTLLQEEKSQSEKQKKLLQEQIEELSDANLQPDEEGPLFEEYTLLANGQELLKHASLALENIQSLRSYTLEIQDSFGEIEKYTSDLRETKPLAKEALLLFEEMHLSLQSMQAKLEADPGRLAFLEERLKLLDILKKKYGPAPITKLEELQKQLLSLDTLEEREERLLKKYGRAKLETEKHCAALSNLRKTNALELEKKLKSSLREMNIQSADVKILIEKAPRTKTGEDSVCFMLKANMGEKLAPVAECSSGGELSRLIFALKTILSEKTQPKTMIFDEIDANVGGETATKMGEKIKDLAKFRQVLCITHFSQVARQGDHHLCVSKSEENDRTRGHIRHLTSNEKEVELLRMLGGITQEQPF